METIKEISTKCVNGQTCSQIAIRCRDHAHIRSNWLAAPHAFKFPLLQDAQESNLRVRGELSHFIEENRAALCNLKTPETSLKSTGESSFFVTEKLRGN
jgi:hypothetical protein